MPARVLERFSPQTTARSANAVVSGTVLAIGPRPEPVRRATVRLAGALGTSIRAASTDDAGQFVFTDVPPGSFTLTASKPGYVTTFYGSKRPGRGPGMPLAITDGQRVTVALHIMRGAVISGTITDPYGRPAALVPVMAVEVRPAGVSAATPMRATTDDLGVYRIYGLAPGEYVVSAAPRPVFGRGGLASATDVLGITDAEVLWAQGAGTTSARHGAAPMPPPGRALTYAPVFFPGTPNAAAAAPITLFAGEERLGVDFSLRIAATARIAGTIVDHENQPVTSAWVSVYAPRTDRSAVMDALTSSRALVLPPTTVTPPDFTIDRVTPGDYTLVARAVGPADVGSLWSVTDLTVDGQDQADLVLRMQPGPTIAGSIVFERGSPAGDGDATAVEVSLVAARSPVGPLPPAKVRGDRTGAFTFFSVAPAAYSITATAAPAQDGGRWVLKSAMLNGLDVADALFEAKPGQNISGVVVTFSDRISEISGRLIDRAGQPVSRYSIVVFTVDRLLWLPSTRRVRLVTPAADGTFRAVGLPAGEYAIAAAEGVEPSDLADPGFLSELLAASHRFTLAEGEKKSQDLRVSR
jgi:hypothetical protein